MYEVTVVYGAGKGEVMWPGPEIIVMIGLGVKKSMQYVLLEAFCQTFNLKQSLLLDKIPKYNCQKCHLYHLN